MTAAGDSPARQVLAEADGAGVRDTDRGPRRRLALPVLVVLALLLAVGAGAAARGFISPAQEAARAAAPAPSLITAPVQRGVLPLDVVLRATVGHGRSETVPAPQGGIGNSVVTSLSVSAGQTVNSGQLIGTVDEEPVFVMQGRVPAFRDLAPGTSGVDVLELQQGLEAAGFGVGEDAPGVYGEGTAAAVLRLYRAAGMSPNLPAAAKGARLGTAAALRAQEPSVPLGEVVFVPTLPGQALSVAGIGQTLVPAATTGSSGGAGSSAVSKSNDSTLAMIGSAAVTLTASASPSTVRLLRVGMAGTAISDVSGNSLRVRVSSARSGKVMFAPVGHVPPVFVGQNVQVNLVSKRVRSLIVPVAALNTSASGSVYLTVVSPSGRQHTVTVRLRLSAGGRQAVTPVHGALRPGEQVVIGQQAR